MIVRKFNESNKYNPSNLDEIEEYFNDFLQELNDSDIKFKMRIGYRTKVNEHINDLKALLKDDSDVYINIVYSIKPSNLYQYFESSDIIEIFKTISNKEKTYSDRFKFRIRMYNDTIDLHIETDICLMTRENIKKFEPLVEKGMNHALIYSNDIVIVKSASNQLLNTFKNIKAGEIKEIENPLIRRMFNTNYEYIGTDELGFKIKIK